MKPLPPPANFTLNVTLRETIAANAGPAFLARQTERQADRLLALLKSEDYKAALALLEGGGAFQLERFVDSARRMTPLLWACAATQSSRPIWQDASRVAVALIEAGANVAARCAGGRGPFFYGATASFRVQEALLDKGACESAALERLMQLAPWKDSTIERCITLWSPSPLFLQEHKDAALVTSCQIGLDNAASELIAAGASCRRSAALLPLLHMAAASGCEATVEALLDAGVAKGVDIDAVTPATLQSACVGTACAEDAPR
jgi:ankyrin repeat protein